MRPDERFADSRTVGLGQQAAPSESLHHGRRGNHEYHRPLVVLIIGMEHGVTDPNHVFPALPGDSHRSKLDHRLTTVWLGSPGKHPCRPDDPPPPPCSPGGRLYLTPKGAEVPQVTRRTNVADSCEQATTFSHR